MDRLPGNKCQFINCFNTRRNRLKVRFYHFPRNEKICKRWIKNTGNPSLLSLTPKQLRRRTVCHIHFTLDSFRGKRQLLITDAIPYQSPLDVPKVTDALKESWKVEALSKTCRCCLKTDVPLSDSCLVLGRDEPINHMNKILCCFTDIELEQTNSCLLCNECVDSLNNAYRFKQRTCMANLILGDYLKELQHSDRTYQMLNAQLDNLKNRMPEDDGTSIVVNHCNVIKAERSEDLAETNEAPPATVVKDERFDATDDANYPIKLESTVEFEDHELCVKREDADETIPFEADVSSKNCDGDDATQETTTLSTNRTKTDTDNDTDGTDVCKQCDETFTNSFDFVEHLVEVHDKKPTRRHFRKTSDYLLFCRKPFKCKRCNLTFVQRSNFESHKLTHVCETRSVACRECDETFVAYADLERHVLSSHKSKPYRCVDCDWSFFDVQELKVHSRRHSNARPFRCRICNLTFVLKCNLISHKRIHNKKNDE